MTYTLTFSYIQNNKRVPVIVGGHEVTLQVEAGSKSATYADPAVKTLCDSYGHDCRVRGIT